MDKNRSHDTIPNILEIAKNLFVVMYDPFNKVPKILMFQLCTPVLKTQTNNLKLLYTKFSISPDDLQKK